MRSSAPELQSSAFKAEVGTQGDSLIKQYTDCKQEFQTFQKAKYILMATARRPGCRALLNWH
jgi:hypothetical protein